MGRKKKSMKLTKMFVSIKITITFQFGSPHTALSWKYPKTEGKGQIAFAQSCQASIYNLLSVYWSGGEILTYATACTVITTLINFRDAGLFTFDSHLCQSQGQTNSQNQRKA